MKELVVISGKGGTGKTSVVASFAALARNKALADCDVDAADLHLVLSPDIVRREDFSGGSRAVVRTENCIGCGRCAQACRFEAISFDGPANDVIAKTYRIDPIACEGCGVCEYVCPADAIDFGPVVNGELYVSDTRHGPLVHAKLGPAQGNSGKLVTLVRTRAKELAGERGLGLVLIDGSPGIGCPVIASIGGASLALIMTEPTPSGLHDLDRVAKLAGHFGVPAAVSVNKADLNPAMNRQIEDYAGRSGLGTAPSVRYDPAVTKAQVAGLSVVEYGNSPAAEDIRSLWSDIESRLR